MPIRPPARAALALAALALAAAGCSLLVDPDELAPEAPATAGALCQRMVAALAARAAGCNGQAPEWIASNAPADVSCTGVAAAAAAGTIRFDAALGATCLESLALASCFELFGPLARGVPAHCLAALRGTRAPGATCRQDLECAGGYCDEGTTCPGTCAAWPTSCAASLACGPGKVCAGGTCQAAVVLGKDALCAVSPTGICGDGLHCDASLGTPRCAAQRTSGTCTAPGGRECLVPGFACTIAPTEPLPSCKPIRAVGQGCTPGAEQCVVGAWCAPAPGGLVGTCTLDGRPPASCASVAGQEVHDCLGGSCEAGSCVTFALLGGSCTGDAQCGPSMACRAGHCQQRVCP